MALRIVQAVKDAILRGGVARRATDRRWGQATVEFAFAGTIFIMIVFGTIDFGRAIFSYSELHNAVREGARVAKVRPNDTNAIRSKVITMSPGLGLTSGGIGVACTGGCAVGGSVTVTASINFAGITQNLFGISPFTMASSARVDIE